MGGATRRGGATQGGPEVAGESIPRSLAGGGKRAPACESAPDQRLAVLTSLRPGLCALSRSQDNAGDLTPVASRAPSEVTAVAMGTQGRQGILGPPPPA